MQIWIKINLHVFGYTINLQHFLIAQKYIMDVMKYWIFLFFSDSLKKYVPCVGSFCCGLSESKRLAKWYAKKLKCSVIRFPTSCQL